VLVDQPVVQLDGANASHLVVKSSVQGEQRVLQLEFKFEPLEVHLLPGALEKLLDFIRSSNGQDHRCNSSPLGTPYQNVVAMSQQFWSAHGDTAKDLLTQAYQQIPDLLLLNFSIASPIVHVPVASMGVSIFSLGHLNLEMPHPCEYTNLEFGIHLKQTSLYVASVTGEKHNIFHPMPISLALLYCHSKNDTCAAHKVQIGITMTNAELYLSPWALRILLLTPTAVAAIMMEMDATPRADTSSETEERAHVTLQACDHMQSGPDGDVSPEDNEAVTDQGEVLCLDVPNNTFVVLDGSGAQEICAVHSRTEVHVAIQFDSLDLVFADSSAPAIKFHLEMCHPGITLCHVGVPRSFSCNWTVVSCRQRFSTHKQGFGNHGWNP